MSWLDKLLGREDAPPSAPVARGWASPLDSVRAETTDAFLLAVASRAQIAAPVLVPQPPDECQSELRGTLRGFELRVIVDHDSSIRELNLRYAQSGGFIDLDYSPELEGFTPPAVEPWDASDKKVFLAPGIFIDGSSADKEAAAFRSFPAALQARVLTDIKRLNVMYFRSRPDNHDVTVRGCAADQADPVAWLADLLVLSADVAAARGARPAVPDGPYSVAFAAREGVTALATRLSGRVPGARIVRLDDDHVDVRFTESGVPVRIALDAEFDDVDVEAHARDVGGAFELSRDDEVEIPTGGGGGEVWDEPDAVLSLSHAVYVEGAAPDVRRAAAMLAALPSALVDELVTTVDELELRGVTFEGEILTATACDLRAADAVERALRLARLLARVAASLPRTAGDAFAASRLTRCPTCQAWWLVDRIACPRCAAG